jgi:hypothetical protein
MKTLNANLTVKKTAIAVLSANVSTYKNNLSISVRTGDWF